MLKSRGKDKNGKWHEGWYACIENDHFIILDTASTFHPTILTEHHVIEGFVEVQPDTVSYSTGQTDKHGDEIFEGMRVIGESHSMRPYKIQGIAAWDDLWLGWYLVDGKIQHKLTGHYTLEIIEEPTDADSKG